MVSTAYGVVTMLPVVFAVAGFMSAQNVQDVPEASPRPRRAS
jgi:hypothetical protein